jgi:hypothetical protein
LVAVCRAVVLVFFCFAFLVTADRLVAIIIAVVGCLAWLADIVAALWLTVIVIISCASFWAAVVTIFADLYLLMAAVCIRVLGKEAFVFCACVFILTVTIAAALGDFAHCIVTFCRGLASTVFACLAVLVLVAFIVAAERAFWFWLGSWFWLRCCDLEFRLLGNVLGQVLGLLEILFAACKQEQRNNDKNKNNLFHPAPQSSGSHSQMKPNCDRR